MKKIRRLRRKKKKLCGWLKKKKEKKKWKKFWLEEIKGMTNQKIIQKKQEDCLKKESMSK